MRILYDEYARVTKGRCVCKKVSTKVVSEESAMLK